MKTVANKLMVTALIAGSVILACNKKKEYPVDTPPTMSNFLGTSLATYFIKDDPNSIFKVPVGITTNSASSRTVTLSVTTLTGATSAQYSVPSTTVTIPAGKVVDSVA